MTNDESVVLLTKIFNRYLKMMNKKKNSQGFGRTNNFQKNKKTATSIKNKKSGKRIQCRECEGFGHIQSECENRRKKKNHSKPPRMIMSLLTMKRMMTT